MGEGFIGSVAVSGEPLISHDVRGSIPFTLMLEIARAAEMVAPIISNDEVIGVFDLKAMS